MFGTWVAFVVTGWPIQLFPLAVAQRVNDGLLSLPWLLRLIFWPPDERAAAAPWSRAGWAAAAWLVAPGVAYLLYQVVPHGVLGALGEYLAAGHHRWWWLGVGLYFAVGRRDWRGLAAGALAALYQAIAPWNVSTVSQLPTEFRDMVFALETGSVVTLADIAIGAWVSRRRPAEQPAAPPRT